MKTILINPLYLTDGLYCAIDECLTGNDHQNLRLKGNKRDRNSLLMNISDKNRVYPNELNAIAIYARSKGASEILIHDSAPLSIACLPVQNWSTK